MQRRPWTHAITILLLGKEKAEFPHFSRFPEATYPFYRQLTPKAGLKKTIFLACGGFIKIFSMNAFMMRLLSAHTKKCHTKETRECASQ